MPDPLEFDWDQANISHIALHHVLPAEAIEVILNRPITLREERREGELRRAQLGVTDAQRILVVVTTDRAGKKRVVTAHDAERRLKQYWTSLQAGRPL